MPKMAPAIASDLLFGRLHPDQIEPHNDPNGLVKAVRAPCRWTMITAAILMGAHGALAHEPDLICRAAADRMVRAWQAAVLSDPVIAARRSRDLTEEGTRQMIDRTAGMLAQKPNAFEFVLDAPDSSLNSFARAAVEELKAQ